MKILRKILIVLIIIAIILLAAGIYLYINWFPYSGYHYEDDDFNNISFGKFGEYSLAASDAGGDLTNCDNEKYLYNKKSNTLNLYCGLKLSEKLRIIEINDNDFIFEHIDIEHGGQYITHMKKSVEYYSKYDQSYESRMEKAGNDVIEKLIGKAFYFENESADNIKVGAIIYFKDKETITYIVDGKAYPAQAYFHDYSGKMIDIKVDVCGTLHIIYDIENNKIAYTNGTEKDIKSIEVDMTNIKDNIYSCEEIHNNHSQK